MLPGEALPGHAVREGLRAVRPRLTQVPHEEGHIGSGVVGGLGLREWGASKDPLRGLARPQGTTWLEIPTTARLPTRLLGQALERTEGGLLAGDPPGWPPPRKTQMFPTVVLPAGLGREAPLRPRPHDTFGLAGADTAHWECTPWATILVPLPKLFLALPAEVSHQPVGVEGVLGRHAPAHDGIQEGFPLSGIEAQDLGRAESRCGQVRDSVCRELRGGRK